MIKANFQLRSFSFFKLVVGSFFLLLVTLFPLAGFVYLILIVIGKAHLFGTWLSMWRAKKLNWVYGSSIMVLFFSVAFLGNKIVSLPLLVFIAYALFVVHFFYDEFSLQEERMSLSNILFILNPAILSFTYLLKDFFNLSINFNTFCIFFVVLLVIEIIYSNEFNWFFIHTKILSLYILGAIFFNVSSFMVINVFLLLHYLFWFIYPVYKLHKYKREEVTGFVIIMLLLVFYSLIISSLFLKIVGIPYDNSVDNFAVRGFLIGTIIHILSTAPFGYLIGLPRPKYEIS